MNQEITCLQCEDLLDKYLDNELDTETYILISSHLQNCQKCQYAYKLAQVVNQALCDLPSPEPSAKLYNQVIDYIEVNTDESRWEQLIMFNLTTNHQSKSKLSVESDEIIDTNFTESNWIQLTLQDIPNL
ncbi:hypothetical protein C6497_09105 [Candidatus Poribacteria bacterium]|nr:MAG: hypothetical protein C6497_09105 [Candidatus Poribacteria bacterium]